MTKIIDDESMPLCSSGGPADILLPSFSYAAEQATTNKEFRVSIRRTIPTATELLRARSTGLYSLISLQPLRSRDLGSQRVSASQIHWLHQNGFVQLAGEFASLKSDDTKNRPLLQRISEGEPAGCLNVEISGPESLFVLVEELRALGLEVLLNHHTDHVSLHMQPASLELIRRTAAAQVKKPETIHYRTYLPQPDGLFCERSFGPESRYRRRTAAHILLSHPIVPPIFRVGSNPILCRALELDAETIESILAHRLGLTPNGQLDKVNVNSVLPTGAVAIGQLLNDRVEPRFPWSQHLVQSFVYVTPPDLRPLVLLDNGNFATSDLNEFYRLVINRNNRLSKLLELNAPRTIINSETYELQCMVDQLHMNGRFHSPTMGDHAHPLVSVFDLVLGHLCETEYKHQDYSAAARLIVDSSIPVDRCLIPTQIFQTLRLSQDEPVLLSIGEIIVARYPNCSDEPVIRISETTAEQLRVCNSQVISAFRPLTAAGVREAISLAYSSTQFAYTELPLLTSSEISDQLIEHIASDQDLSLVGPQWLIVGGTGSTQCAGDAELPREHQQQIEIPNL